jgi:hypothetical protein
MQTQLQRVKKQKHEQTRCSISKACFTNLKIRCSSTLKLGSVDHLGELLKLHSGKFAKYKALPACHVAAPGQNDCFPDGPIVQQPVAQLAWGHRRPTPRGRGRAGTHRSHPKVPLGAGQPFSPLSGGKGIGKRLFAPSIFMPLTHWMK